MGFTAGTSRGVGIVAHSRTGILKKKCSTCVALLTKQNGVTLQKDNQPQ